MCKPFLGIDTNEMNQESQLLEASIKGDKELVLQLLEKGVSPNCKDNSGRGPLLSFFPEIIKLLIKYGANPNQQLNENGHSVLSGLCYANSIFNTKGTNQKECIKLLIENGANLEIGYNPSNETPLHHATAPMGNDNPEIIELLLINGANPNSKTIPNIGSHNFYNRAKTKGETPLHRAAAFCSNETIEILINFGANKEVVDSNGETPLSWACWYRRPKSLIDKLLVK